MEIAHNKCTCRLNTAYNSLEIALNPKRPKIHQKRVKNLTSEWIKKNNNTSFHMLLDHCYAFGLLL